MKLLSRVIFINWYLFEFDEWDIRGHVALLGKNASGKSSFIDALQLVLLGGNKSDWVPNAKATDKNNKRDIRSYALGLVKDEAAIGDSTHYQPREDALTRVVLVFKDNETGESTTIGACLSASKSEPHEQVEGFFILEKQALRLQDFIKESEEGQVARTYASLKAQFLNNARSIDFADEDSGGVYFYGHEPQAFVEQMLRSLGDRRHPPSYKKFKRAFKQSIKLSGLQNSVSDFVKQSILDASPIDLNTMRSSIETLENKKDAVARAIKQIQALEEIERHFTRATNAAKKSVGFNWCAAEFTFDDNTNHIDELSTEMVALFGLYRQAKTNYGLVKLEIQSLKEELREVTAIIDMDDARTLEKQLNLELDHSKSALNRFQESINSIKDSILFGAEVLLYKDQVTPKLYNHIEKLLKTIDQAGEFWLDEFKEIDSLVTEISSLIPNAESTLSEDRDSLVFDIRTIREELQSTGEKLNRLNTGRYDLRPDTIAMIEVLNEHNIKAIPICELVEVSDLKWQPAIEAYLRTNTEALVVDVSDAKDAIEIYRGLKRHRHIQVIVIDTEKVDRWSVDAPKGSPGSLIEGDNPIALKYIRKLLGGIELHEDTNSIRSANRAMAPDGSFQRSAGFTKLRLPEYSILGKGAIESQKQFLSQSLDRLTGDLAGKSLAQKALEKSLGSLSDYKHRINQINKVGDEVNSLSRMRAEVDRLTREIAAIDTSHLDDKKKAKRNLDAQLMSMDKKKDDVVGERASSKTKFRQRNKDRKRLMTLEKSLATNRDKWSNHEYFDPEVSDNLLQELESEFSPEDSTSFSKCIAEGIKMAEKSSKRYIEAEKLGLQAFSVYTTNHPDNAIGFSDLTMKKCAGEVGNRLRIIREVGLQEREAEVGIALHKLTQLVRIDLSIKLRGQIEEMKRRFDELNKELSDRPFSSKQRYDFRYSRIPEYKEFLDFVENVSNENVQNVDSLFDDSSHINGVIQRILADKDGDILGDYRNYYTFDIAIKDTEANIEEMLSRKGPGSGGEHMTPFYVAMGASLASSYRLSRRDDDTIEGGLSLYLADEAFEKMDYANTLQAAEYLKSIGLQLFAAAPDSAEADLRSFVDTVLFFIRDGTDVMVNVDYVTPWAQETINKTLKGHLVHSV